MLSHFDREVRLKMNKTKSIFFTRAQNIINIECEILKEITEYNYSKYIL